MFIAIYHVKVRGDNQKMQRILIMIILMTNNEIINKKKHLYAVLDSRK